MVVISAASPRGSREELTHPLAPEGRFRLAVAVSLLVAVVGVGVRSQSPEAKASVQPNVLLISIDTLRADHVSSYGYSRPTSPFLDQLAMRGIRFSHAFVNTHGTPSSHTTMLTSLSQQTHGVAMNLADKTNQKFVAPRVLTMLPEIFAENGYRTVGVTGGAYVGRKFGFDQGFDSFESVEGIQLQTERMAAHLRGDDRPTFAFLHTYEVHSPYQTPPAYAGLFGEYESEFVPTSENLMVLEGASSLSDQDRASVIASYDRGIRYTDDVLGRFFARLRESGFLDNGIVLVTSDHGEEFGEHGRLLHSVSLYEELLHVPFILIGPGIAPAVSDPRLVSTLDVAPTLLSLAGLEIPSFMQGADLSDRAGEWSEDQFVISQFSGVLYSIRTHRWKLIGRPNGDPPQLYDLSKDPREARNVVEQYPEIAASLSAKLRSWYKAQPALTDLERTGLDLNAEDEEQLRALGYL